MNDLLMIDMDTMLEISREMGDTAAVIYIMMGDNEVTARFISESIDVDILTVQRTLNKFIEKGYIRKLNNKKYKATA